MGKILSTIGQSAVQGALNEAFPNRFNSPYQRRKANMALTRAVQEAVVSGLGSLGEVLTGKTNNKESNTSPNGNNNSVTPSDIKYTQIKTENLVTAINASTQQIVSGLNVINTTFAQGLNNNATQIRSQSQYLESLQSYNEDQVNILNNIYDLMNKQGYQGFRNNNASGLTSTSPLGASPVSGSLGDEGGLSSILGNVLGGAVGGALAPFLIRSIPIIASAAIPVAVATILSTFDKDGNLFGLTKSIDDIMEKYLGFNFSDTPAEAYDKIFGANKQSAIPYHFGNAGSYMFDMNRKKSLLGDNPLGRPNDFSEQNEYNNQLANQSASAYNMYNASKYDQMSDNELRNTNYLEYLKRLKLRNPEYERQNKNYYPSLNEDGTEFTGSPISYNPQQSMGRLLETGQQYREQNKQDPSIVMVSVRDFLGYKADRIVFQAGTFEFNSSSSGSSSGSDIINASYSSSGGGSSGFGGGYNNDLSPTSSGDTNRTSAEDISSLTQNEKMMRQREDGYGMPEEPKPQLGDLEALKEEIAKGEGDYGSYNRGVAGDTPKSRRQYDITQMTVGEILAGQAGGRGRRKFFAVGKYQFIPETLKGAVEYTGVDLNSKFDAETQEKLFEYLISSKKRKRLAAYLEGRSNNVEAALDDLAYEFASIPDNRGKGKYDGDRGGNAAAGGLRRAERIKQILRATREKNLNRKNKPEKNDSSDFNNKTPEIQQKNYFEDLNNQNDDLEKIPIPVSSYGTTSASLGRDLNSRSTQLALNQMGLNNGKKAPSITINNQASEKGRSTEKIDSGKPLPAMHSLFASVFTGSGMFG